MNPCLEAWLLFKLHKHFSIVEYSNVKVTSTKTLLKCKGLWTVSTALNHENILFTAACIYPVCIICNQTVVYLNLQYNTYAAVLLIILNIMVLLKGIQGRQITFDQISVMKMIWLGKFCFYGAFFSRRNKFVSVICSHAQPAQKLLLNYTLLAWYPTWYSQP